MNSSSSSSSSSDIVPPPKFMFTHDSFVDHFLFYDPPCLTHEYLRLKLLRREERKSSFQRERRHVAGAKRLVKDYFDENPVYNDRDFRRQFRMSKPLFLKIVERLKTNVPYFMERRDTSGRLSLSTLQKVSAAVRMLAFDVSSDDIDESTTMESMKMFCRSVYELFSEQYLRKPTQEDVARIREENAQRGFPGLLGSVDCMYWTWKNCPDEWAKEYQSKHQEAPSIILQAIASKSLWIWHAYFGVSGYNDINVMDRLTICTDIPEGENALAGFEVNGNEYKMCYYLVDDIYPDWELFVKTIQQPLSRKNKAFVQYHEMVRKDVERAFGVLQARWHIVKGSSRLWDPTDLEYIMKTCVILHNMIVEDESPEMLEDRDFPNRDGEPVSHVAPSRDATGEFTDFIKRRVNIQDGEMHRTLRNDLIDHIWEVIGNS